MSNNNYFKSCNHKKKYFCLKKGTKTKVNKFMAKTY